MSYCVALKLSRGLLFMSDTLTNGGVDDISSYPKTLVKQLKQITQDQEVYRVKGFVNVPNKPMRLVMQGVGDRFDYFFDRPWREGEPRQTKLVFIGDGVKEAAIAQQLVTAQ